LPYFKHIQVKYFYKNITQALMCNFRWYSTETDLFKGKCH
jgi:hypothetical protein